MSNVKAILGKFLKDNPAPKCELNYSTDFNFLVAIILSAQSTDKRVNIVTEELFKTLKTPQDVLDLGIEKLEKSIKTIGMYRSKARNILKLSDKLITEHNGKLPYNFSKLLELPGVGRKTASVFLNTLTGANYIAVDTHVERLSRRLGFSQGKNPLEIENDLKIIIPKEYQNRISNWLVLHGRYVCKAKKPDCKNCIISDLCQSSDKKV